MAKEIGPKEREMRERRERLLADRDAARVTARKRAPKISKDKRT